MKNTVRYAAGDWFLVARERGLVLLPQTVPVALLESVWQRLESGSLSPVIDALTEAYGMSLSAIPPFAVAITEDDDLRIAVRGGMRVAYDDGSRHDLITGGRVQTWVEQTIPPYSTLVLTPPDAEVGELMLPLASGVVRTGLVMIGSGQVIKPGVLDGRRSRRSPDEDELVGPAMIDDAEVAMIAAARGDVVEEPVGPLAAEDVSVAEEPVADGAPLTEEAEEPHVSSWFSKPTSSLTFGTPRPITGDVELPVVPAPEIPTTSTGGWFSTGAAQGSDDAAEQPVSDEIDEESVDADDAVDEQSGDVEASTDSDAELSDVQVDQVFAAITDRELGDPAVPYSDHDGLTIDHVVAQAEQDAADEEESGDDEFVGRVVLSTGRALALDRVLVLGRRPRVTRTAGGAVPALVTIDSPTHDISRNHIEIRREGDMVLVTDLNTTNGTVLLRGEEAPRRLHPGEATLVVNGDVIDIGDEVTVTFEDLP